MRHADRFCSPLTLAAKATYAAIGRTYSYLTPDLWPETPLEKTPYQMNADFLAKVDYK